MKLVAGALVGTLALAATTLGTIEPSNAAVAFSFGFPGYYAAPYYNPCYDPYDPYYCGGYYGRPYYGF